jgi:AraC family transcriptional regulator
MVSQQQVHASDVLNPDWIQARQAVLANGLTVEHHVQPAGEVEAPPLVHHSIGLFLNCTAPRRVTQFAGQAFDGQPQRGDLSLVAAGLPSHWYWEGQDELMLFILQPELLHQIAAEVDGVKGDRLELLSTVHAHDPKLLSLALSFQEEMQQPQWGNQLYLESLANLLCIHLLRNYCMQRPKLHEYNTGLPSYQLKQVQDFIQVHLAQDVQLVDLAQTVNMSRYYFIKLFKQSTGITPHQYLLQQRIHRAQELLTQQREQSIADIALQCGFANQSHLTRQFRQIVGTTPRAYRASQR